jgi:hypothetical protein
VTKRHDFSKDFSKVATAQAAMITALTGLALAGHGICWW